MEREREKRKKVREINGDILWERERERESTRKRYRKIE